MYFRRCLTGTAFLSALRCSLCSVVAEPGWHQRSGSSHPLSSPSLPYTVCEARARRGAGAPGTERALTCVTRLPRSIPFLGLFLIDYGSDQNDHFLQTGRIISERSYHSRGWTGVEQHTAVTSLPESCVLSLVLGERTVCGFCGTPDAERFLALSREAQVGESTV